MRAILGDRSGSALVEFALTAPLLTLLLLSVCDVAPTLMAKFKVVSATQSMADLTALTATVSMSDITNIFYAGGDVMAPFSSTGLNIRISNIASDGNQKLFVYWSCAQGMTPFSAGSVAQPAPTGTQPSVLATLTALGKNTSYVMVETSYTYTAPARFFLRSPQTMTSVAYTLPRVSTYVAPTDGTPTYVARTPTASTTSWSQSSGNTTCLAMI